MHTYDVRKSNINRLYRPWLVKVLIVGQWLTWRFIFWKHDISLCSTVYILFRSQLITLHVTVVYRGVMQILVKLNLSSKLTQEIEIGVRTKFSSFSGAVNCFVRTINRATSWLLSWTCNNINHLSPVSLSC